MVCDCISKIPTKVRFPIKKYLNPSTKKTTDMFVNYFNILLMDTLPTYRYMPKKSVHILDEFNL